MRPVENDDAAQYPRCRRDRYRRADRAVEAIGQYADEQGADAHADQVRDKKIDRYRTPAGSETSRPGNAPMARNEEGRVLASLPRGVAQRGLRCA